MLKTILISIVVLVPLAWGIILLSVGSFSGTMESIFLDSFLLPIIFGGLALGFVVKGIKATSEQKKYNNNISVGILLILITMAMLLFIIKNAWSV